MPSIGLVSPVDRPSLNLGGLPPLPVTRRVDVVNVALPGDPVSVESIATLVEELKKGGFGCL